MNIYFIRYLVDGKKENTYQIPAKNERDALVRLGQIHGDDKDYREDLEIEVLEVTLTLGYERDQTP